MSSGMPARHTRTAVESEDRNLVLAFQAGHDSAYDEIYRRYQPMAERICRRYLPNPADAEEAAQETMLRVLKSLQEFNGRYALRAWVARIATNVCLDALRAHGRRNGEDLKEALPDHVNGNGGHEGDPSELLERLVHKQEVEHHLARLPERHRIALVLREVEGMSHSEIASVLSTTPPRVKALLHRARQGFRREWNGNGRSLILFPLAGLTDAIKKLWGRAAERATELGGSAPGAAVQSATPVVSTAAERTTTAVAAVMIAGAVGLAGATRSSSPDPSPDRRPRAAVVEQAPDRPEAAGKDRRAPKREVEKRTGNSKVRLPGREPAGTAATLAVSSGQVAPGQTQEASDAVRPAPAQPSGFTFSFSSDWTGSDECNCTDEPTVAEEAVRSSAGAIHEFSSRIVGAAIRDASGQPRWRVEIRQSGTEGEHNLEFFVWTNAGTHSYTAGGGPVKKERTAWGGWSYTFSGSYLWRGGPGEVTPLPARGIYTAVLAFSHEQNRLVDAVFTLSQSEASAGARTPLLATLI